MIMTNIDSEIIEIIDYDEEFELICDSFVMTHDEMKCVCEEWNKVYNKIIK